MALFLCPPSVAGFDGGAGSRYQARREVTSFWYPTWLAQPAALVPGSKLMDCAPHGFNLDDCLREARNHRHVIIHTSTPTLQNDAAVAEAIKRQQPDSVIGFVGAHPAVLPAETLNASWAIDWVGGKEFDFTCKEVCEDRPLKDIQGLSFRNGSETIHHNTPRPLIENMDSLPWVADVYKRDLQVERYAIGYLQHPYLSLYTGRGCPAQCTFCLWPQTIGGHRYRVRSAENVGEEMAYLKQLFPQVKEFFFDDDTFTANLPRAREVWKRAVANLEHHARDIPAARESLRELLGERIVVRTNENGDLVAEIAASSTASAETAQINVVAGAGFEPATFGL